MLHTSEKRIIKSVSFSDEIDSAPSPVDRNSTILFEHHTKTYLISEAISYDENHVIKVDDPRISLYDVAQIRSAFNAIDTNRNGYIEMSELRKFLKRISRDSLPMGMATTILKQADQNKDGVLSFEEFFRLCQAHDWLTKSFIQYCGKIAGFVTEDGTEDASYEYHYVHSRIFPLAVYTFTILQIIFFLNDQLTIKAGTAHNMTQRNATFSVLSSTFLYSESHKYEIWRFVTYMLVHADFLHLASNLFLLITAGIPLEVIHGCRSVLLIYCTSGIISAIGVSAISHCLYLVGSSAGAFGLLAAHFSTLILNWNEIHYKFIRILILSVFVIVNSFVCLYSTMQISNGITTTTISHVGGFIMGLLVGILTLKNIKVLEFEKQLRHIVKLIVAFIVVLGVALTICMPNVYKIAPAKLANLR